MEDELVLLNLKWKWLENLCDDGCGGGGGGDGDVGGGGGGVMVAEWRMNWYC